MLLPSSNIPHGQSRVTTIPDPMARLKPPHVPDKPVPVFAAGDLALLEHACAGRSFQQRPDVTIIAVLAATGIRLSQLAGIRIVRLLRKGTS
jgi:integrase/recombinase XerC